MKINKNIYTQITSEPFEVQELENGVIVELHSMNQNERLYNTYIPQSKFVIWTNAGTNVYRLLLEDGFYKEMRDMYMKRCNQEWVNFWGNVEKGRGKLMKCVYLPVVLLMFAIIGLFMFLPTKVASLKGTPSTIILTVILVAFLAFTVFLNKKIDKIIRKHNQTMVDNIKNIVGHKHFDELIENQRAYYDKFFHQAEAKEEEASEEVKAEEAVIEEEKKEE